MRYNMDETFLQQLPVEERANLLRRAALFWPGAGHDAAAKQVTGAFIQNRSTLMRASPRHCEQVRLLEAIVRGVSAVRDRMLMTVWTAHFQSSLT